MHETHEEVAIQDLQKQTGTQNGMLNCVCLAKLSYACLQCKKKFTTKA